MWRASVRGAVCVLVVLGLRVSNARGQQGTLTGTVLDATTARPINGATVEVVGQSEIRVRTDLDGKFALPLPVGTYELRVSVPLYRDARLRHVIIAAGQPAVISTSLSPKVGGGVTGRPFPAHDLPAVPAPSGTPSRPGHTG